MPPTKRLVVDDQVPSTSGVKRKHLSEKILGTDDDDSDTQAPSTSGAKRKHLSEEIQNLSNYTPIPSTSGAKRKQLSKEIQNPDDDTEISLLDSRTPDSIRSGKIIRIKLKNFMCHSHLIMEFNSRVNMLIGSNGSGKSAVLSALTVGLGAKARATNRCTSIKKFIKHGENSADIEITIGNDGPDTYEEDTYGKFITINRHITSSGGSSYKIKNEHGQVVSKKIEELNKLLLYHNIQTDNPVFVLNQDSARNFLREMEPSKNYQLFLKATQIETVVQTLLDCGTMYNSQKIEMNCLKQELENLKSDLNDLNKKYELIQSVDGLQVNVNKYELQKLWLKVTEQENLIEELNSSIEELRKQSEKYQGLLINKDKLEEDYNIKIQQLELEYSEKTNSIHAENAKLNQLKMEFIKKKNDFKNEEYNQKRQLDKINSLQDQMKVINERIAERSGSQILLIQRVKKENELKLKSLRNDQEQIFARIEQKKQDLRMVNETKLRYEEQFEELKGKRAVTLKRIENSKRELRGLDYSSKNQLSVYGADMEQFLEEIKRAHAAGKFTKLPRGPLGRYIEVQNQKWRDTVEYLLGNLLRVFLVHNHQDQKVFDSIRLKYRGLQPTVITMPFREQVYDIRNGKVNPPTGTVLLMNEIKCTDTVVINCMIDRASIEKILLCEEQKLAVHYTSRIDNVPRNLRKLILLSPFLEYFPAPSYRTYSLHQKKARFLQMNLDDTKKNIENEIVEMSQEISILETRLREWKSKLQEIYPNIARGNQNLAEYKNSKDLILEKIKEIESIEYPEENQVEFLKKEKDDIEVKIEMLKSNLEKLEDRLQKMIEERDEADNNFQECSQRFSTNDDIIQQMRKNIDDKKSELRRLLSNSDGWNSNNKKIIGEIGKQETKLAKASDIHKVAMDAAAQKGERVSTKKSDEELQNNIDDLNYNIKQISEMSIDMDQLKALCEDKQLNCAKSEALIEILAKNLELLKQSRLKRFRHIMNLKHHMALRVKYTFDSVLKVKDFQGELSIDHQEQKLTMKVIPRDGHIKNAVSNTKSLSGGERSYSTVAFLLSLWSCVDHPFYFLDEYDVFTDQINREIMTKLLLTEADKKPHRQYTFLTPQNISFLEVTPTLTIQKLSDPL